MLFYLLYKTALIHFMTLLELSFPNSTFKNHLGFSAAVQSQADTDKTGPLKNRNSMQKLVFFKEYQHLKQNSLNLLLSVDIILGILYRKISAGLLYRNISTGIIFTHVNLPIKILLNIQEQKTQACAEASDFGCLCSAFDWARA